MKELVNSIAVLLGKTPTKPSPEEISAQARAVHEGQAEKLTRELHVHIRAERAKKAAGAKKWRRRRWAVLIGVNLLFVLSYWLDIQLVEGALTGSRFVGFHMADRHPHPDLQSRDPFVVTLEEQAKAIGIPPERARDRLIMSLDLT